MDKKVEIYTSPSCHFCHDAKAFLDEHKVVYEEHDVTDEANRKALVEKSKQLGVPVLFIGEGDEVETIIGFDKSKLMESLGITA